MAALWHTNTAGRRFSIERFLAKPGVLIHGNDPVLRDSFWPTNALLLKSLTQEILRRPNTPGVRHWFVPDEFRAMPPRAAGPQWNTAFVSPAHALEGEVVRKISFQRREDAHGGSRDSSTAGNSASSSIGAERRKVEKLETCPSQRPRPLFSPSQTASRP